MKLKLQPIFYLFIISFNNIFTSESPSYSVIEDANLGKSIYRTEMQDSYDAKIEPGYAFFAVYDGHGSKGAVISKFAASNLQKNLLQDPEINKDIKKALESSFIKTYNSLNKDDSYNSGTTAIVAYIKDNKIYIANAGDSRAVLASGTKIISSVDHKPNEKNEIARLDYINKQKEKLLAKKAIWQECRIKETQPGNIWRMEIKGKIKFINGEYMIFPDANGEWMQTLAMSRALGDKYLVPCVGPWPDITEHNLTDQEDYLILASDGIWDDVTNKEAVEIVRKFDDVKKAAGYLVDLAKKRGSQDNITIIVVDLKTLNNEMKFLKLREDKMYEEYYSPTI